MYPKYVLRDAQFQQWGVCNFNSNLPPYLGDAEGSFYIMCTFAGVNILLTLFFFVLFIPLEESRSHQWPTKVHDSPGMCMLPSRYNMSPCPPGLIKQELTVPGSGM